MQVNGDGVIIRLRQQIDELNFNKIVSDTMVAELLAQNQELLNTNKMLEEQLKNLFEEKLNVLDEAPESQKTLEENAKTAKQAKAN